MIRAKTSTLPAVHTLEWSRCCCTYRYVMVYGREKHCIPPRPIHRQRQSQRASHHPTRAASDTPSCMRCCPREIRRRKCLLRTRSTLCPIEFCDSPRPIKEHRRVVTVHRNSAPNMKHQQPQQPATNTTQNREGRLLHLQQYLPTWGSHDDRRNLCDTRRLMQTLVLVSHSLRRAQDTPPNFGPNAERPARHHLIGKPCQVPNAL